MMAEELKPCPFCGGEAVLSNTRVDAETSWWNVECHHCGAQAPPFAQKLVAVLTWNTRHTPIDRDCPQERFDAPFTRPSTPPAVSDDLVEEVEALGRARNLAMKNTVAARVPECGDFGAIAQDLDWLQNELPAIIQRREQQAAEAMRERCGSHFLSMETDDGYWAAGCIRALSPDP